MDSGLVNHCKGVKEMTGKIKALALALFVIMAASAIAVAVAQAGQSDIGAQPAVLSGQVEEGQKAILTLTSTSGSNFSSSCTTNSGEGTTVGQQVNEATATVTLSGCTIFGVAAQVLMNGCKFTSTGAGQPANTAIIDIVGCTSGKQIEKRTAICTLHFPEQNGLSHVVGSNLSPQEVTASATITGIKVQQTGAACPDGNNHTSTNVSLSGNGIGKARVDVGGTQVTKHNHQYVELSQAGAQTTVAST